MTTTRPPLEIPDTAIEFKFIRSSGPGGQNVNKVATAVQARLDLNAWPQLDYRVRARLETLAGRRLTDNGEILIIANRFRTQEHNKRDALERLGEMIEAARVVPKVRRPTKPTRASKERRLEHKQKRGDVKKGRSTREFD